MKFLKTFESYEPIGQCFSFAFKMALNTDEGEMDDKSKFKVVHGMIRDKWHPDKPAYAHAWIVKNGIYFDWQNSSGESQFHGNFPDGMKEEEFYELYLVDTSVEYTAIETMTHCAKQKHHGPWHE